MYPDLLQPLPYAIPGSLDGWLNGQASYAYAHITPQYVRQQIGYVWNVFKPKGLYDLERTLYYKWFLRDMLKRICEDGVNVIGALAWSLLDNGEFFSYDQQYGLQHVNGTNGHFTRSFKRSMQ